MVRKKELGVLLGTEDVVVPGSGLGIFFLDWCAAVRVGGLDVDITHEVLRE